MPASTTLSPCPCGCTTPDGVSCFVLAVVLPAALSRADLGEFAPRASALLPAGGTPAERLAAVERSELTSLSRTVHRAAEADPGTRDAYYSCLSFCLSVGFDTLDRNPLVTTGLAATTAHMALHRAVTLLSGSPEGLAASLVLRGVPPCTALAATEAATGTGAGTAAGTAAGTTTG